jgi:hypothetical protein
MGSSSSSIAMEQDGSGSLRTSSSSQTGNTSPRPIQIVQFEISEAGAGTNTVALKGVEGCVNEGEMENSDHGEGHLIPHGDATSEC